jgi:hypothetical protein
MQLRFETTLSADDYVATQGHCTFNLLPDFIACRLPGILTTLECAVLQAEQLTSIEQAANIYVSMTLAYQALYVGFADRSSLYKTY